MTARFMVADVFDGLASLETGSVDLVVTSPPFLALRSYLPADHELKGKEIGSEATPAEFIDTLLKVTAELRRVLAPHGSICVELGDTYAGSGGAGGDWSDSELTTKARVNGGSDAGPTRRDVSAGWPLPKSRTLIPSLYQIALAYGFNPLTGQPSPAGQWRIRNVVTWARPNPPVGALGDKWRPATSDLIIACTSGKRYWDDLATRNRGSDMRPSKASSKNQSYGNPHHGWEAHDTNEMIVPNPSGAPLLDYWVIPPGGYTGAHYAVFPEELVVPCVQAMCPQRVCVTCGEPSRRIVEPAYVPDTTGGAKRVHRDIREPDGTRESPLTNTRLSVAHKTLGFTDCGHDTWRPGLILDCFAGSGTTLAVATGHGHDAVGIDLDRRNLTLARDRVGPFLFEEVEIGELQPDSSG